MCPETCEEPTCDWCPYLEVQEYVGTLCCPDVVCQCNDTMVLEDCPSYGDYALFCDQPNYELLPDGVLEDTCGCCNSYKCLCVGCEHNGTYYEQGQTWYGDCQEFYCHPKTSDMD